MKFLVTCCNYTAEWHTLVDADAYVRRHAELRGCDPVIEIRYETPFEGLLV